MLTPTANGYHSSNNRFASRGLLSVEDSHPAGQHNQHQYYYHFPNAVAYWAEEKERVSLPMLPRVLSSRALYAVSLPPTRKSTRVGRWKYLAVLLLLALLVACFWLALRNSSQAYSTVRPTGGGGSVLSPLPPQKLQANYSAAGKPREDNESIFGVVFDAGSTGSRVNVFQLTVNHSDPSDRYVLTDQLFRQVKPGLSAFAEEPEQAAKSLRPLIQAAQGRLPLGYCPRTPVLLRATAGLRLLSAHKAENILDVVRKALEKSCFQKPSDPVSILDGNLEGLYVWISLNSLLQRIPSPSSTTSAGSGEMRFDPEATVGTLDLGGGSTQITFAPDQLATLTSAPPGFVTSVLSGKPVLVNKDLHVGSQVYSHSYLGLGLMSARFSMLHTLTRRLPSQSYGANNELYSPCVPKQSQPVTWSYAGQQWTVIHLAMEETKEGVGSATTSQRRATDLMLPHELKTAMESLASADVVSSPLVSTCYALALTVLRDPVEGDASSSVYPPSNYVVHRPSGLSRHRFYAFSYLFDLATSIGLVDPNSSLTGLVTVGQFRDAILSKCQSSDPEKPFECMDLCFITALLHDGYGFPWEKELTLQKKVGNYEINWGLGAFYSELYARQQALNSRR